MTDAFSLLLAAGAGLVLGGFFFGGLWWTVRRGMTATHPALWFLGSTLLRTGVSLGGFYWVAAGDWQRLLACCGGFIVARIGVTWLTRPPLARSATEEARRAS